MLLLSILLLWTFVVIVIFVTWWCCKSYASLAYKNTLGRMLMKTPTSPVDEYYVVMLKDTVNELYMVHQACRDGNTVSMSPYIEDAIFLMTWKKDSTLTLQTMFPTVSTLQGYLSDIPSSNCPGLPSIHPSPNVWQLRNPQVPSEATYTLSWVSNNSESSLQTKLASIKTDNNESSPNFIRVDNTTVSVSRNMDEASTVRMISVNVNGSTSANVYMGIVQLADMYINHTSAVPTLSKDPLSIFYNLTFTKLERESGFHETSFTIQAHPNSNPAYFPGWYLNWDLNAGCVMQSSDPMEWKFEITDRVYQPFGVVLRGYLKHMGYYLDFYNNKMMSTPSLPRVKSTIGILNDFML